ncbi:MAG: hypothetical protein ACKOIA_12490 [Acidimicrobiia bacterium]
MLKRATWFTIGAVTGVVGAAVAYVRARELVRERVPESVQDAAGRVVRAADTGARVAVERTSDRIEQWRRTTDDVRRTRQEAESLLRHELERSGL